MVMAVGICKTPSEAGDFSIGKGGLEVCVVVGSVGGGGRWCEAVGVGVGGGVGPGGRSWRWW